MTFEEMITEIKKNEDKKFRGSYHAGNGHIKALGTLGFNCHIGDPKTLVWKMDDYPINDRTFKITQEVLDATWEEVRQPMNLEELLELAKTGNHMCMGFTVEHKDNPKYNKKYNSISGFLQEIARGVYDRSIHRYLFGSVFYVTEEE